MIHLSKYNRIIFTTQISNQKSGKIHFRIVSRPLYSSLINFLWKVYNPQKAKIYYPREESAFS